MKKIYGVGINDADYPIVRYEELPRVDGKRRQKLVWKCPFYTSWHNMLSRCYANESGKEVCQDWFSFKAFKAWMETQDWQNKQLDKDLFGNNFYSPDTCVFISKRLNVFLAEKQEGNYMTGVAKCKKTGKYIAYCWIDGTKKNLGYYLSEMEAHKVWKAEKLRQAKLLAIGEEARVSKALIERFT